MTTYESIRGQIKTGDVFFTKSPAFFSRMIRLFTQSKVSHVGLFVIIENRIFCIETMEGKGCVMTLASQRLQE